MSEKDTLDIFREFAKTVKREEFINGASFCPKDYGIDFKGKCWSGIDECRECMRKAVDSANIRFLWEGEKMSNTKTFQEVIRDIKEGDVWEVTKNDYTIKSIEMMSGHIILNSDEDSKEDTFLNINPDIRFKLQRKKVSFTEAFAALEKGKEIESYIMGYKYKYFTDVHPRIYRIFVDGNWVTFSSITLSEIQGDWYINE